MALFMIVTAGLAIAQEKKQAKKPNQVHVKARVETRAQIQTQNKLKSGTQFIDQNGDGINDLFRDHDNDGIPNGQDPDWIRPQDGTGYKEGRNGKDSQNLFHNRKHFQGKKDFTNEAFRNAWKGFGAGFYDSAGPKGGISRKGRN